MDSVKTQHDVFQAIADPTRRKLLKLLANEEKSISEIVMEFSLSRTAINKHLKVLSDAGLVSNKRVGRENRYKLNPKPLSEVKNWLTFFEQYWNEQLLSLKKYVEEE